MITPRRGLIRRYAEAPLAARDGKPAADMYTRMKQKEAEKQYHIQRAREQVMAEQCPFTPKFETASHRGDAEGPGDGKHNPHWEERLYDVGYEKAKTEERRPKSNAK